ncbi:MAG: hypothetical protein WCL06_03350 [Bacteroidota bacterium]
MKKSMLFAILALVVYMISTVLLGVFAKPLNLIHDEEKTNFTINEKFHHVNITARVEGYCQLSITEGGKQELSFGKMNSEGKKPDYYVKNDTLYVKVMATDAQNYNYIDIASGVLSSVTVRGDEDLYLNTEMNGSVKEFLLSGPMSLSLTGSRIDTLNIHADNKTRITVDTCQINQMNLFHKKGAVINFNISRSPLPDIRQWEKAIVQDTL